MKENDICPKCGHHNAMLGFDKLDANDNDVLLRQLKCRDCGYVVLVERVKL